MENWNTYDLSVIGAAQCVVFNNTAKQLQAYRSNSILDTYVLEEGAVVQIGRTTNGNYATTIANAYCQDMATLRIPLPGHNLTAFVSALAVSCVLFSFATKLFSSLIHRDGDENER